MGSPKYQINERVSTTYGAGRIERFVGGSDYLVVLGTGERTAMNERDIVSAPKVVAPTATTTIPEPSESDPITPTQPTETPEGAVHRRYADAKAAYDIAVGAHTQTDSDLQDAIQAEESPELVEAAHAASEQTMAVVDEARTRLDAAEAEYLAAQTTE